MQDFITSIPSFPNEGGKGIYSRSAASPKPLHRHDMVPRHYPFVLDFHAEAGGVGWDDVAVFGHGEGEVLAVGLPCL